MKTELPFSAMQSGWKMLAKWAERDNMTDSDWDELVDESRAIWEASGKDKMVGDVLTAFLKELERRSIRCGWKGGRSDDVPD